MAISLPPKGAGQSIGAIAYGLPSLQSTLIGKL